MELQTGRGLRSEGEGLVAYYGARESKPGRGRWILLLVLLLLLAAFFSYPTPVTNLQGAEDRVSGALSFLGTPSQGQSTPGPVVDNPALAGSAANISYPSNYGTLANFSLALINSDRAAFGLSPVALSSEPSGQQHSDSMLYFGYFSHWDTQGYKPYMRYTLLGGTGAMEENIALAYCTPAPTNKSSVPVSSCTLSSLENALRDSEWQMMYNDVQCCANGHRDNILNPTHNYVSIGIAYSTRTSTVYFTEDFESAYVANPAPILTGKDTITFSGTPLVQLGGAQVLVFFDPTPQPMTVSELDATTSYDPGSFVGGVVAPCALVCPSYKGAVTVEASSWKVGQGSVNISFSLGAFASADGPGVYTIYLQTGSSTDTAVMQYSAFVSG
jgi:uncharacterized protein YkwD